MRDDLFSVSAASTSDVWAVGTTVSASGLRATLAEHWTGSAWHVLATPNPGQGNQINGVADISRTNAWAVGVQGTATGGSKPLIIHWNGTKWTPVSSPSTGGVQAYLNRVAALASNDLWAVGTEHTKFRRERCSALIEHYDGQALVGRDEPESGPIWKPTSAEVSGSSATRRVDRWRNVYESLRARSLR